MEIIDEDDGMEAISLNKKENIIEAYSLKPTLPYDIEGVLVEKDSRKIRIEKTLGEKSIIYDLRLKEEIPFQVGEKVKIDKGNILSIKVEEIEEENTLESIDLDKAIRELGFEDIEETKMAIEYLINNNISIDKDNLESFFMSKRYLKEIVENIDFNSCIELFYRNIDIEEDSLQRIAEGLKEISKDEQDISIMELLKSNRDLSYKEAETIARDIYGTKMGKDVYDSIMALHRQKIPINKENIENVMEVIHKLQDLKEYDDEILIRALKEEITINIENLYKLKHSYNTSIIDTNITSFIYDSFTVEEGLSLEDILSILKELGLDEKVENINLIREFIVNELEITEKNISKIINMKKDLEELVNLLDEVNVIRLIEEGVNPLKEDISQLVEKLKTLNPIDSGVELREGKDILKEIEELKTITYRDLINLIKSGEDFKLENLKEIKFMDIDLNKGLNGKVAEKAIAITNIFNALGELNSDTIALATKKYSIISLNNLYESQLELNHVEDIALEPISQVEENFIRQEYLNAKNNTTLNLIKMSIRDGLDIEYMDIGELNEYIDKNMKKTNNLKRLSQDIIHMKGKEGILVSMAMKNHLNMSINQLSALNNLLHGSNGLGYILDSILMEQKYLMAKDIKEGIQVLEDRIKEFSTSLKEGKDRVKEDYKDVLKGFKDLNQSWDFHGGREDETKRQLKEYIELQDIISQEDLILQLPMVAGEGYKNINLIIPNIKKGIDKNQMLFYFNMDTEYLGELTLHLEVKGRDVYIDFEGYKGEIILEKAHMLERGLNSIGYNLKGINNLSQVRV